MAVRSGTTMFDQTKVTLGIVGGIGIGIAFGVGMGNLGDGIAFGDGIGVALGIAWSNEEKGHD